MRAIRKTDIVFGVVLLSFGLYAFQYIMRTSFVVDGERYYALFDDAMISMRYAKNLAHGLGLVWNAAGERVQGFTNPLWVLYMAILHLLPVGDSKMSLFVQITGLLLLVANLLFVRKIADSISGHSTFVSLASVILTAFYLPLNTWSLQGTEVSILTFILTASIWVTLRCLETKKVPFGLYTLLGLGTLVRIDAAVAYCAILAFLMISIHTGGARTLCMVSPFWQRFWSCSCWGVCGTMVTLCPTPSISR
ncbi:MAG TPA: glycosyltransferase family 39 protein [Anaerolineae bacterium]|nr:glycosyltransferase family 39 protein [Anaerolineae bacterium]